jgi:hypothetical protein
MQLLYHSGRHTCKASGTVNMASIEETFSSPRRGYVYDARVKVHLDRPDDHPYTISIPIPGGYGYDIKNGR